MGPFLSFPLLYGFSLELSSQIVKKSYRWKSLLSRVWVLDEREAAMPALDC